MTVDARSVVARLFLDLEDLSRCYAELTDSDVREAIHRTLNHFFIWNNDTDSLPRSFGMFSAKGDQEVAKVILRFLSDSAIMSFRQATHAAVQRLALLQDGSIVTPEGRQYDEFIGHVETPLANSGLPPHMFRAGKYRHE